MSGCRPAQIAYTIGHAKAEILLVHHDFFATIESVLSSLPDVKVVIAILDGISDGLPHWATGEYESLLTAASSEYRFEDFDENAVATTFYTTGTTGKPKGVCFTHRQLVLHTLAMTGPFGASAATPSLSINDVYMPLTPMFHVHAWGIPYIATMLGVKQVYPGRYDATKICSLRSEHGVTYSHCVPTVLEMVLKSAEESGSDLTDWKMTVGGSALTKVLYAEAQKRGMTIGAAYGMSETCPFIAQAVRQVSDHYENNEDRLAGMIKSGTTVPLVSARIVDEEMNDLPNDGRTRGELVLRSPWLTSCYTGDRKASDELWRGGWLHTQDIATIDGQGHIQIRDRLKDVIKTGGEWIDSIHLEELVATTAGVTEASVIAVPDVKWGERPLAVVVPKPGVTLTLAMLNVAVEQAIVQGTITRYAKLDRFITIGALPRTSVGKIDKKLLRARVLESETSERLMLANDACA